jgi:hypothetical protein
MDSSEIVATFNFGLQRSEELSVCDFWYGKWLISVVVLYTCNSDMITIDRLKLGETNKVTFGLQMQAKVNNGMKRKTCMRIEILLHVCRQKNLKESPFIIQKF